MSKRYARNNKSQCPSPSSAGRRIIRKVARCSKSREKNNQTERLRELTRLSVRKVLRSIVHAHRRCFRNFTLLRITYRRSKIRGRYPNQSFYALFQRTKKLLSSPLLLGVFQFLIDAPFAIAISRNSSDCLSITITRKGGSFYAI